MNYQQAEFRASYGVSRQLPPSDCPEIVFSGHSNVGKSSALNRLFNRKGLARTSSTPGKTITVNFFDCPIDKEHRAVFADLPGYGYAKRSGAERERWAELINGYLESGRDIRLVVQLLDARHPASEEDEMMLDYLRQTGFPFVVLLTKVDKLNKTQRRERMEGFAREIPGWENTAVIPFSAENGEGVEMLKKAIEAVL